MRPVVSAFDARAADVGDFSPPIFQFDFTLLVPAGALIRSFADADRPEIRIAAVRNHASTIESEPFTEASRTRLRRDFSPTFDLLRTGQADAMASARPTLLEYSTQLSGTRVLEDRYGANINRMVVPKGKAGWLAYVSEFVEEAKASGLVQKPSTALASAASRCLRREMPPLSSECVMGRETRVLSRATALISSRAWLSLPNQPLQRTASQRRYAPPLAASEQQR